MRYPMRIGCAGLFGEIGKQGQVPGARLVAHGLHTAARPCLRTSPGKGAAAEIRPCRAFRHQIENGEDFFPGGCTPCQALIYPDLPCFVALLQIGANQLFLAAEAIVKRGLGHPGALDHTVDADEVHAFFIKQFICSGEQAFPGRTAFLQGRLFSHGLDINRQVCMMQRTDRSVCLLVNRESAAMTSLSTCSNSTQVIDRNSDFSRNASFYLLASITISFLAGSVAPTPLYSIYQERWGFSSITVTLIFGIYALSVLTALLFGGRLSDHLGRRPVLIAATAAQTATMMIFATASGVGDLMLARIIQGLATGAAMGAVGAGMIDLNKARGTTANAVAPTFGTATGAMLSGYLVQYVPAPTHLVYVVLGVIFVMQGVGVALMTDTITPAPGALASLKPQLSLPVSARGPLLLALPVLVASWALAGFYGALGPMLLRGMLGVGSALLGGLALFVLAASAGVAVLALQDREPRTMMTFGASMLALGAGVAVWSLPHHAVAVFFAGTSIAGIGFGTGFQGAIRSVVPLAAPHERSGLLSIVFIVSYLSMGVPAVAAGVLIARNGNILGIGKDFGIAVMTLALGAVLAAGLRGVRRAPITER